MMESLNRSGTGRMTLAQVRQSVNAAAGSRGAARAREKRDSYDSVASEVMSPIDSVNPEFPTTAQPNLPSKQQQQQQQVKSQQEARSAPLPVKEPIAAALDPRDYPDTPAFREIEAVLRKIRADWPVILQGSSEEIGGTSSTFDPISLGLSLLDPSTVGTPNSLPAFLRLKAELDHAISSTLSASSTSHRAYENSIATYNSTLSTLTNNVKQVEELRRGMTESRDKLESKGREGLGSMYHRMGHLEEMVKILDEM